MQVRFHFTPQRLIDKFFTVIPFGHRPLSEDEAESRAQEVVKCSEAGKEVTLSQNVGGKLLGRTYHFDRVFDKDTSQDRLYQTAISPMVEEVLAGFNCTIFAYGQTGTGKTFTMTGDVSQNAASLTPSAGVIPRAVGQIFSHLESLENSEYSVRCSFLELYNEEITDLLTSGSSIESSKPVRILEDPRAGVVLAGLEEVNVSCCNEIFEHLDAGNAKRRTAETLLNKQSSRSHSVFIVSVSVREILADGEEVIRVGKLYLVDLAGSENITRSGAVDARAKEAGNINKSLLTLGRVITALVEGQGHIPYRDSKLTRLLRDSLGGRTKTCIIATIAPTVQCQEETLSTLDYAHRAKNIKNRPEINQKISKTTHLKEMSGEIERLRAELVATREKNGVYLPVKQYEEDKAERAALAARVECLEEERVALDARFEELTGAVQRAEMDIKEKEFIIDVQASSEKMLADHAMGLNTALASASADVLKLFECIDAKNALEDSNLRTVNGCREETVAKLGALREAIEATAKLQSERFGKSKCILEGFRKRRDETNEQVFGVLKELEAAMQAAAKDASETIGALASNGLQALAGFEENEVSHIKELQKFTKHGFEALFEHFGHLQMLQAKEQAQLTELLEAQSSLSKAVDVASKAVVQAAKSSLDAQHSLAQKTKNSSSEAWEKHDTKLQAFAARFSEKSRAEEAKLVKKMEALVSAFAKEASQHVVNGVNLLVEHLSEQKENVGAQLTLLEIRAKEACASIDQRAEEAAQAHVEQLTGLEDGIANAQKWVCEGMEWAAKARDQTDKVVAHTDKALGTHSMSVSMATKEGMAELKKRESEASAACAAMGDTADASRRQLSGIMQTEMEMDSDLGNKMDHLITEAADTMAQAEMEQRQHVSTIRSRVLTALRDEYAADQSSRHIVPPNRCVFVPPASEISILCAAPPDELAATFRRQISEGRVPRGKEHAVVPLPIHVDVDAEEERNEDGVPGIEQTENAVDEGVEENTECTQVLGVLSPSILNRKRGRVSLGESPVVTKSPAHRPRRTRIPGPSGRA